MRRQRRATGTIITDAVRCGTLALDLEGIRTVLSLRSRFGVPQKTLTDPDRQVDLAPHRKAFGGR